VPALQLEQALRIRLLHAHVLEPDDMVEGVSHGKAAQHIIGVGARTAGEDGQAVALAQRG